MGHITPSYITAKDIYIKYIENITDTVETAVKLLKNRY